MTKSGVIIPLIVSALALGLLGALGSSTVAFVEGAVVGALAAALAVSTGTKATDGVPNRTSGDGRVVRACCFLPAIGGALAWAICVVPDLVGLNPTTLRIEGDRLWPWQAIGITIATTAGVIGLSSLVDWCRTAPKMSGNGDAESVPCRTSTASTWLGVTRIWLLHRIVAYVVVRVALVALAVFVVALFRPEIGQPAGTIIGAVGAAAFGFFFNRLVPVASLVSNPPLQVGDKIVLAEEYGTGVEARPIYYVVDVAFEGVKLRELRGQHDAGERAVAALRGRALAAQGSGDARESIDQPVGEPGARTHDRTIGLGDVARLLRARDKYTGCRSKCSGVNQHCPFKLGDPMPTDDAEPAAAGASCA